MAQKQKIDSLQKALPHLKDAARIDCLNALSEAYRFPKIDSAEKLALQALSEAEKISYNKGAAIAWYRLALTNWAKGGDWVETEKYCKKAIALLDKTEEKKLKADIWCIAGIALYSQGKKSEPIQAYSIAERLYASIGDELNQAKTYNLMAGVERGWSHYKKSLDYAVKWLNIAKKYGTSFHVEAWAALYNLTGDYQTALSYYHQAAAQALAEGSGEPSWLMENIGEIYFQQKQYDSAKFYYQLTEKYFPSRRCMRWGDYYLALKQYDSAFLFLNETLNHSRKTHNSGNIMYALKRLSKAYFETGNYPTAVEMARECIQIAAETEGTGNIRDGHLLLYQVFERIGKNDSAFVHLQQYVKLKDSLGKELNAHQLWFYKAKSERESEQYKISLLKQENKIHLQQLQQTSLQRKFLIAAIIILIFVGIIFLRIVLLKRKNEEHRHKLVESELQVQKAESERIKAELQQKATGLEMQALRAQMNPHFIFNSLNSINRFILENNKFQASEYLTKFSRLVRLIMQNSQHGLVPLEQELEALQIYLELEALRFDYHFDFKITVEDDLEMSDIKVPPLIIQPYAENAIWHGLMNKQERGQLEIEIFQEQDLLSCKITDNGIGRKKAAELKTKSASQHKSMGMRITADRIALLHKNKQSEPSVVIKDLMLPDGTSGGTEVILKIPVHHD